jgi:hypothetical protein
MTWQDMKIRQMVNVGDVTPEKSGAVGPDAKPPANVSWSSEGRLIIHAYRGMA